MTYEITNNSEMLRRIGGVWIKPGATETVTMRALPAPLIAKWRRAGVWIREVEAAAPGIVGEAPAASTARASSPFDRDGDGRYGGSLPADEVRADITAAELADKAERRAISYQTLRRAAARFVRPVPRAAGEIVAALKAHDGQADD